MADLITAALCVALTSAMLFVAGLALGRRRDRRPGLVVVAGCGVLFVGYLVLLRDSVLLLGLVPVSSVAIAGDPTPGLAALCAGVLAGHRRVARVRRALLAGAVVAAGWYGPFDVLTRRTPPTQNYWAQGVCLQTTDRTCGPAAAATLLKHYGVDVNESALARDCLTDEQGTHLTGLYRGLALHAPDHRAPRGERMSVAQLLAQPGKLPAIVSLKLTPERARAEPRYAEQWGWEVGVMHSVVVLGPGPDQTVRIADPGVGLEQWSVTGLRDLWTGEVLYLGPDL